MRCNKKTQTTYTIDQQCYLHRTIDRKQLEQHLQKYLLQFDAS